MLIVGIDPGLSGAMATLLNGRFVQVEDLPVIAQKSAAKVSRKLDPASLAVLLRSKRQDNPGESVLAVVERVSAMPGQGVSSIFSLGDTCGAIRGVLAALGWSVEYVTPQEWKKFYRLSADKAEARSAVIERVPEAAGDLTRVKDHNRAEAILIAKFGHQRFA